MYVPQFPSKMITLCQFQSGMGKVAGIVLWVLVLGGVLLFSGLWKRAAQAGALPMDRVLFHTILADLVEPGRVDVDSLPIDVRQRARSFQQRAKAFLTLLPTKEAKPGPELWACEKKQEMERAMVALIERTGIEESACQYAREAVLAYEWEGMSDGPLAEAGYAEAFLREHLDTPLKPYLTLFLIHRFGCAAGALANEKKAVELAERFVADRKVDLSDQHIGAVTLQFDMESRSRGLYWLVQWQANMPRLGGEYGLRVYMDGRIMEARLGP